MTLRLQDKVAIITGAASGIGKATTELFLAEGASVVAVDLRKPLFQHNQCECIVADITDADAPDTIINAAASRFGKLDILYNNAGISSATNLAELSDADWDHMMELNLRAAFRLTKRAVSMLQQSLGGRIIATASGAALLASSGMGAYSVSKAALHVLMRSFAADLGPDGITANTIVPGPTRTSMVSNHLANADIVSKWKSHSFLERIGEPEEIASAALFLASSESSYVTGQMLVVDGGFSSKL